MSGDLIRVCDLWERQTRKRDPYLVGAMAGVKVLLFKRHNADPDGPAWTLFFGERAAKQVAPNDAKPSRSAERGQGTWDRVRELSDGLGTKLADRDPVAMSPADRQEYAKQLAEAFDRQGPDDLP